MPAGPGMNCTNVKMYGKVPSGRSVVGANAAGGSHQVIVTLLRHYKVILDRHSRYTPAGYVAALQRYDDADVADQHVTLPLEYEKMITSTMKRALQTFAFIYGNRGHEQTALLNEVPMMPFTSRNREYDVTFLDVMSRLQWMFNSTKQPETRRMSIARAGEFIDRHLVDCATCLVVGHGFFLRILSREMLKRNFKGKEIVYIRNGEYRTFETA